MLLLVVIFAFQLSGDGGFGIPRPGDLGGAEEAPPGDIEEGIAAAKAVGDDRIQERTQGRIDPETFTHGTSEQRVRWFRVGFDTGDPEACETFDAEV